jgi:hypothetical protein
MSRAALGRWVFAVTASALTLTSAACLQPSLSPLLGSEDARTDARLIGTWACDASETWTVSQKDDTEDGKPFTYYEIRIKDGDRSGVVQAILGRLGSSDFLSFSSDSDPDGLPRFVRRQYLNIYTFGRVFIEMDHVRIAMMPADWSDHHRDDAAYGLGAPQGQHGFVLTAPTKALQSFALAHADDTDVFKDAVVLVRPGSKEGTCYSEK